MSALDVLIDPILRSPRLPQAVAALDRALAEEQCRRERFVDEVCENQKAEFIDGEVIVHSPASFSHGVVSGNVAGLLRTYVNRHALGVVLVEKAMVALTRNNYEPDVCFFGVAKSSLFSADQRLFPAPDLVVEILSPSTQGVDRGVKMQDYALHGVDEYWLLAPSTATVEQYLLNGDAYELNSKGSTGQITSRAIVGLTLPVPALFDEAQNLAALRALLA